MSNNNESMSEPLSSCGQQFQQQLVDCQNQIQPLVTLPRLLSDRDWQCLASSDFIRMNATHHPEWLMEVCQHPPEPNEWYHYQAWLAQAIQGIDNEDDLTRILRQFHKRILFRIAWSQAAFQCSTEDTLLQLSELADQLLIQTRDWLYPHCCQTWGTPYDQAHQPQTLIIIAMGKLGGKELNFSSDIDLIFTYHAGGTTEGGRRQVDHQAFFTKLGQRLIKLLTQSTCDGFVYRVDMRLRPFGDSGPLVLSLSALEHYYQEHGRDWERYAMLKGRVIGSEKDSQAVSQLLRPFIYRRYIDFSVIQSLREMKLMIEREVRRRNLENNIKLGQGGIRELEFIVQIFQLIRGGREPALRQFHWLDGLNMVEKLALLTTDDCEFLRQHYLFLRRLENLLQAIQEQQTQELPEIPLDQQRLAWGMRLPDWMTLIERLNQNKITCRSIFNQLIGNDTEKPPATYNERFQALWLDKLDPEELTTISPNLHIEQAKEVLEQIQHFRTQIDKRTIGKRGRDVLDQLMPHVLAKISGQKERVDVLTRVLQVIINVVSRTTYLELLLERQTALQHLVNLCGTSAMVADQFAQYPILLDELINLPEQKQHNDYYLTEHYLPKNYTQLLNEYLLRIDEHDEEQQIDGIRQFKQAKVLRIAISDIEGHLPVMKVSDQLTYLAESIITKVVNQAWSDVTKRYGYPAYLTQPNQRGFAIIGYGKLGGKELAYSSDLDLVFVSNCPLHITTTGPRQLDGRQFYTRLVQRIMHLLSTRTSFGTLYEVDLRLRPEGSSGVLVTSMEAFEQYQQHEAWCWEHQALVRARVILGDDELHQHFQHVRHNILTQPRKNNELQSQIATMREKMYAHQHHHHHSEFHLKSDRGGLIDIEFMVQYAVLYHANQYPQLTEWQDNVRALTELITLNILPQDNTKQLINIYMMLRQAIHQRMLQEKPLLAPAHEWEKQRHFVQQCWQTLFGSPSSH